MIRLPLISLFHLSLSSSTPTIFIFFSSLLFFSSFLSSLLLLFFSSSFLSFHLSIKKVSFFQNRHFLELMIFARKKWTKKSLETRGVHVKGAKKKQGHNLETKFVFFFFFFYNVGRSSWISKFLFFKVFCLVNKIKSRKKNRFRFYWLQKIISWQETLN